eukprot:357832-Chlamydomonas_euryale.AAC.4
MIRSPPHVGLQRWRRAADAVMVRTLFSGRSHAVAPTPSLLCASYRKEQLVTSSSEYASASDLSKPSTLMGMCTDKDPQQQAAAVGVPAGKVELIVGPMFAGKTTELLRRVREHRNSGHIVGLVKPSIDKRFACAHVITHTGDKLPCLQADRLLPVLDDPDFMRNDILAIDEAQFFPDLIDFVTCAAETHLKTLLIAGLDGDFKRCVTMPCNIASGIRKSIPEPA